MSRDDRPAVSKILGNTREFKPFEVEIAEELIGCYLDDPTGSGYHVLVAEVGSVLAGYICYGPTPMTKGTWDIYWMAVAPEMQGRGIGSALMKSAEQEIIRAKGRLSVIETSSTPLYEKTIRFHLGQGYEVVCRMPDFYAPGDDKLLLQKRLS
jgi:GNAT superfamily N-acetyltransferase